VTDLPLGEDDPPSEELTSRSPGTDGQTAAPVTTTSRAALTGVSWQPRRELELSDWVRQGRWLGGLGRASGWWIGDWLRYGNSRYGEKYDAAARVTGYDVQTLMNMAYVASRFEVSRRRENLSFSHHAELAALLLADQDLWLDRAEAGRLSVRGLRQHVRDWKARLRSRAAGAATRSRPSGRAAPGAPDRLHVVAACPQCGFVMVTNLDGRPATHRDADEPTRRA
jgi:hypothetical protein